MRDSDNGRLILLRDVQALADAIERLIRTPDLRARMGGWGRRRVVEDFSEEQIVVETLRLYQEVVPAIGLPARERSVKGRRSRIATSRCRRAARVVGLSGSVRIQYHLQLW